MIFVVLGTWEMPFLRPLRELEDAASRGLITEPIVVQCGATSFESPHMRQVAYFSNEELEEMYRQASFVICQAGVGSIMLGLRLKKKVISIARRGYLNEHIDDHQLEILNVFSVSGAILPWNGNGDLPSILDRVGNFVSTGYPFGEERISRAILDYLEKSLPVN